MRYIDTYLYCQHIELKNNELLFHDKVNDIFIVIFEVYRRL